MDASLREFQALIQAPAEDVDLARAALAVARIEYPDLCPEIHVRRLDELAARSGVPTRPGGRPALERLRRFLFEDERFQGNADEYYDPRNSCLNEVLARRLGIPITLSVLTMEVGRRVGLDVVGIGLPGHFIVGVRLDRDVLLLDPFAGGSMLTRASAGETVARALGRRLPLTDGHFTPCSTHQIVIRMLRNLKTIYSKQAEWGKALAVIDRLLLIDEQSPVHRRDRGTALVKLGQFHHGAAEWERYLTEYPHAQDADSFRQELRRVRQNLASLN